jgi:acyl-CoA synthetase (AMP-forming)/AMP-acid ligase II
MGRRAYTQFTFEQLDQESDRIARGLRAWGVPVGSRLVLMVRPSLEFIALTFGLFKAGMVIVLIDPGMGKKHLLKCLEEAEPDGFVAIPIVHPVRWWHRRKFPKAIWNVSVGRRVPGTPKTYRDILGGPWTPLEIAPTLGTDPAAVIFTSGSTGPPKGVQFEHGMFDAQVRLLRDFYGIQPGEIDLPGFPPFALFNAAMGVTTVIPDMDPTRPAKVDPEKILEAIRDNGVTQSFGSPAFWNRIGRYCEQHRITLPTIRRGLSAGGPVPNHVLQRMSQVFTAPGADLHTPYGATESLPVASIGAREVLERTAPLTRIGRGTCVGRAFPEIDIRILPITEGPIESSSAVTPLPSGEIGEIVVRGPSVTREYFRRPEATHLSKIPDGNTFWHRIGDVGYLDDDGLLWFCGRKAHIVETESGRMLSVCCEAIFENHPNVYRAALIGLGSKPRQRPVIVIEPEADKYPRSLEAQTRFVFELMQLAAANPLTKEINDVLFHPSLPVDTRHNVKINREALAEWAATEGVVNRG